MTEIIYNHPLFQNITPSQVDHLLTCLNTYTQTFEKEETIFHQGETVHHLGIILEGDIFILRHDIWGNTFLINNFNKGDSFCESYACKHELPQDLSIVSHHPSTILFIHYDSIIQICHHQCPYHYQLIRNLLTIITEKNIILSSKLSLISKKTIRERVLAYLSEEAIKHKSQLFTISLSRQELANYLGVDRSALSSELSHMKDDQLIDYHKSTFKLLKVNTQKKEY